VLKYKIWIKLFALSCVLICCVFVCGDTILAEVVLMCLLVVLYTCLKMATLSGRNM
jgi:hypothetical protein